MSLYRSAASTSRASSSSLRPLSPKTTHTLKRALAIPAEIPPFVLPEIRLGSTHFARYHEHYDTSLSSDLLYMNYDHRFSRAPRRPLPQSRDMTPYEANQTNPLGNLPQKAVPLRYDNIPRLEKITLHVMNKRAVQSKHYLLPTIMALRVISGESRAGGGMSGSTGVKVIKSKTGAANWKLREGCPSLRLSK